MSVMLLVTRYAQVAVKSLLKRKKPYGYLNFGHKTAGSIVITNKTMFDQYKAVSYRHCKGSNMASASKQSTCVVNFQ